MENGIVHHLYIALCAHNPKSNLPSSPYISSPLPFTSLCLWVFIGFSYLFICWFKFCIPHMSEFTWFSTIFCLKFLLAWYSQDPSILSQMAIFHLFLWLRVFHCVYVLCLLYPKIILEGHLSSFHVSATVSNVTMNIGVHVSLLINVFNFSGRYPEERFLSLNRVIFFVWLLFLLVKNH